MGLVSSLYCSRRAMPFKIGHWVCVAIPLSLLPFAATTADTNTLYLEDNGYIHFEAEDANNTGQWRLESDIPGYSGTGFLEWTGANHYSEAEAGNGTITYHFRVNTAGNYEFRWRTRIAKGDSHTDSNDSWVRFNTGTNIEGEEPLIGWSKVYIGEADVWTWSARTVDQEAQKVRQYFTQGVHTVELSGRSNGHAIDRLALYHYSDTDFDAGLNGTLPLSQIQRTGGTLINPNPLVTPSPEERVSERINVEPVAAKSETAIEATCVADTLTLPLKKSATLSLTDSGARYDTDQLLLEADQHHVLLAYDLSIIPPISAAHVHYTTGSDISNGSLSISLGSHNEWPTGDASDVPNASVSLTQAEGGWEGNTRYATRLDASLLPRDLTTLLMSVQTGSDSLVLAKTAAPELTLEGDSNFCSDWQTLLAEAGNSSGDTGTTTGTTTGLTTGLTTGSTTGSTTGDAEPTNSKKKSGGISLWFVLLLLAGLSRVCMRSRK